MHSLDRKKLEAGKKKNTILSFFAFGQKIRKRFAKFSCLGK